PPISADQRGLAVFSLPLPGAISTIAPLPSIWNASPHVSTHRQKRSFPAGSRSPTGTGLNPR
ncbi:MAG: hypothetical protein KAI66_10215, partial [Lentisphaeria bacterium]|nr:hypothetical protein [Lentisphaeria bacterium]